MSRNEIKQNTRYLGWVFKRNRWFLAAFALITAIALALLKAFADNSWAGDDFLAFQSAIDAVSKYKYFIYAFVFITVVYNFNFLYSKREIDFIHGAPISREKIFMSSFFISTLTSALCVGIMCAIMFSGVMKSQKDITLICFLNALSIFLSCTAIAAICSFFAVLEKSIVSFLFFCAAALVGFPLCVGIVLYSLLKTFSIALFETQYIMVLFPAVSFSQNDLSDIGFLILSSEVYAAVTMLFIFLGIWAYRRRKSEKTHDPKPDAFSSAFLIACAATLLFGACFTIFETYKTALTVACLAFGVFLAFYVIFVLKKFNIKSAVVTAVVFVLVCVSAVSLSQLTVNSVDRFMNMVPNLQDIEKVKISSVDYKKTDVLMPINNSQMNVKNTAVINDIDTIKHLRNHHINILSVKSGKQAVDGVPTGNRYLITYYTNSGKKISRILPDLFVSYSEKTFDSNGYKNFKQIIYSPEFIMSKTIGNYRKEIDSAYISQIINGKRTVREIKNEDIKELYYAYLKDIESRNYTYLDEDLLLPFKLTLVFTDDENTKACVQEILETEPYESDIITPVVEVKETLPINSFSLSIYDVNTLELLVSKGYINHDDIPKIDMNGEDAQKQVSE